MEFFKFIFWRFYPDPRVGEEYCRNEDYDDPWNDRFYTVVDQKGNWYRIRGRGGFEESASKLRLVSFFRKTADPKPVTEDADECPF